MALIPTTLDVLKDLFVEQIRETEPRIQSQQAKGWAPYEQSKASASRTRRFRVYWEAGNFVTGGIFSLAAVDTSAPLRIRVDYVGRHEELAPLIQDDFHQIRDRLHKLTADGANGLILVQGVRVEAPSQAEKTDVAQYDLVYQVRYLQRRG